MRPDAAARSIRLPALAFASLLLACACAMGQDGGARRNFSVPPGPLSSALTALAAQAGVLFSADAKLVEGRTSTGLEGAHDLASAFAVLLRGSGLRVVQGPQGFMLERIPQAAAVAQPPASPASTTLPQITVRGQRWRETPSYQAGDEEIGLVRNGAPLREAPQAITVLTRDFIQDVQPQSVADLLRYVPGIGAAQGEGNRDTPVFRGASSTTGFLVNGLRDDVQYYRDLYNVERVEALRGPNAMMVGHGAVAGLINRVTKEPGWTTEREIAVHAGSQQEQRVTLDSSQVHGERLASRINLLYEDSGGFRDFFSLRRLGFNPVVAWRLEGSALLTAGFEHFQDERTADRGIPSYAGRPVDVPSSRFFGNPDSSVTWVRMNAVNAQLDLPLGEGRQLRSRLRVADYDKFFQNVFAGTVRPSGGQLEVALAAHNSRIRRQNIFSQTDLTATVEAGGVRHALLAGIEVGRQVGDNRRTTGFFGPGGATTVYVPLSQPVTRQPMAFRSTPGDPDSSTKARTVALYVQDGIRWSPRWEATLGMRYDRFAVDMRDNSVAQDLAGRDGLWSPRAALTYKPREALSLYAGYGVGYAPRAGELLSSLNLGNQALRPEKYANYEVGAKWQPRPQLETSVALYRLERRNVLVTEEATQEQKLVQGQRTHGLELSLSGHLAARWQAVGAYAWQDSRIRTPLSPAMPAGATMPHVPRHSASLWNRIAFDERWAVGLGIEYRGAVFTSTDNRVRLPSFTRIDAALFHALGNHLQLRLAIENLLDRRYYAFAHSNNNIMPGAPRALKATLTAAF